MLINSHLCGQFWCLQVYKSILKSALALKEGRNAIYKCLCLEASHQGRAHSPAVSRSRWLFSLLILNFLSSPSILRELAREPIQSKGGLVFQRTIEWATSKWSFKKKTKTKNSCPVRVRLGGAAQSWRTACISQSKGVLDACWPATFPTSYCVPMSWGKLELMQKRLSRNTLYRKSIFIWSFNVAHVLTKWEEWNYLFIKVISSVLVEFMLPVSMMRNAFFADTLSRDSSAR